jgi:hypothetical protein
MLELVYNWPKREDLCFTFSMLKFPLFQIQEKGSEFAPHGNFGPIARSVASLK